MRHRSLLFAVAGLVLGILVTVLVYTDKVQGQRMQRAFFADALTSWVNKKVRVEPVYRGKFQLVSVGEDYLLVRDAAVLPPGQEARVVGIPFYAIQYAVLGDEPEIHLR